MACVATAGAAAGAAGAAMKSGEICDKMAYDMWMRQKCATLERGEMDVKIGGVAIGTVKGLADSNFMVSPYYKEIEVCQEGGYLPKDSKGMTLP